MENDFPRNFVRQRHANTLFAPGKEVRCDSGPITVDKTLSLGIVGPPLSESDSGLHSLPAALSQLAIAPILDDLADFTRSALVATDSHGWIISRPEGLMLGMLPLSGRKTQENAGQHEGQVFENVSSMKNCDQMAQRPGNGSANWHSHQWGRLRSPSTHLLGMLVFEPLGLRGCSSRPSHGSGAHCLAAETTLVVVVCPRATFSLAHSADILDRRRLRLDSKAAG